MSNECKAVPVNCRQRLAAEGKAYPRSSCASCGQFSPNWRECESKLARPVPPPPALGGEPEVVAEVVNKYGDPEAFALRDLLRRTDIDKLKIGTELIDRAHLAPLQVEIDRHKYKAELYDEVWELATGLGYMNVTTAIGELRKERDQLQARCDEQGELLRQCHRLLSPEAPEGICSGMGDADKRRWWYAEVKPTLTRLAALSKTAGSEQA